MKNFIIEILIAMFNRKEDENHGDYIERGPACVRYGGLDTNMSFYEDQNKI